ncbi:2-dehydropantoate 2-reductase [Streptacidiphilus monticola]|uniref:2-dehydropantoate 2-reductase n=1 Tax=Streptacidiphilus monticola TaxID=2161674 RepID=A0ABW1FWT4_9ACTN
MTPPLRIAVLGAGSIGCYLGGRLAAAEAARVTLIGRPAAMAQLGRDGLLLTDAHGERPVPPEAFVTSTSASAAAPPDVVLVTVKSGATAAAARELAPHLKPGAVVVSFQNGLRNPAVLAAELPKATVLAGMVPYNVLQTAPGRFHRGTGGVLMLADDPSAGPLLPAFAAAGLTVQPRADMPGVQAAKLLMNLNNAVNALSGLPLREQLGQRAYRVCLARCQREALRALRAEGIEPARMSPVPPRLMPLLLRLPDAVFRRVAKQTLAVDAQARSSMWEDFQRGRRTEIDALQGEVVALASKHGLAAPANSRLAELVRDAESTTAPAPWSGPALLSALSPR